MVVCRRNEVKSWANVAGRACRCTRCHCVEPSPAQPRHIDTGQLCGITNARLSVHAGPRIVASSLGWRDRSITTHRILGWSRGWYSLPSFPTPGPTSTQAAVSSPITSSFQSWGHNCLAGNHCKSHEDSRAKPSTNTPRDARCRVARNGDNGRRGRPELHGEHMGAAVSAQYWPCTPSCQLSRPLMLTLIWLFYFSVSVIISGCFSPPELI